MSFNLRKGERRREAYPIREDPPQEATKGVGLRPWGVRVGARPQLQQILEVSFDSVIQIFITVRHHYIQSNFYVYFL